MSYLVLSQPSEAYAEAISAALWGISRPASVRSEKDSQFYTSWSVHPTSGSVALYVPDETQPVHVDADIDELMGLIDQAVTMDEANAIRAIIEGRKGQRINFLEVLQASPSLSPNLKTRDELDAQGWFPSQDV